MTEEQAIARLEVMTASSVDPVLSETEIGMLLDMCRLADADDNAPDDADWTPTWDLNRAAAEGWRWKAGKAAARFDFSADGAKFDRSQIVMHCERMAAQYARRIMVNMNVSKRIVDVTDLWIANAGEDDE
jgi:hypothetical protein